MHWMELEERAGEQLLPLAQLKVGQEAAMRVFTDAETAEMAWVSMVFHGFPTEKLAEKLADAGCPFRDQKLSGNMTSPCLHLR